MGNDWVHEIRYDGYRMHARIDGRDIKLLTRLGRPATGRDPMIGGRVLQETINAVDAWTKADGLTRSKGLAPLWEAGLKKPLKVDTKP